MGKINSYPNSPFLINMKEGEVDASYFDSITGRLVCADGIIFGAELHQEEPVEKSVECLLLSFNN